MKKLLSIILLLALAAAVLTACAGGSAEARKLSFAESASIETLNSLNGKSVTLTGYMATLSPLSGEYIYLMNLPYQSCPFCVPNTQQLANTMAVYAAKGSKFSYTDRPVRITGKLQMGDFTDEYGYTYNYRIVDAKSETVDLSTVSEEYATYQSLAEDGVIADVNAMFDYLLFVCQWTEYQGGYTDENGQRISYYLYPGDVENALEDDSGYGYAAEASADYYPGLIARVKAVGGGSGLSELTAILEDAQALERRARSELSEKRYVYDDAADKYFLNDAEALNDQFYEIYGRFTQWLTQYEL
ncbi:MAG: hypothetical protein IJ769_12610 [Clostridia bacterium]|nr:hypothetical protein [Clostridia bacterium]